MKFRPTLFWDTDPKKIDPKKHAHYIIERIADFGNDKEARWALQYYEKKLLRKVVEKSRSLHPRTRNLWRLMIKH